MNKLLFACVALFLTACSAEHQRQQATVEALHNSGECAALSTRGMRVRCIGTKMLEEDQKRGIDPKYDIQKIDFASKVEDAVDKGQMSSQEADTRIKLQFAAIDALAKNDDRRREAASNAAMGAAFQRGMHDASASFRPTYRPTANCTTMPLGAGQYTTHCY